MNLVVTLLSLLTLQIVESQRRYGQDCGPRTICPLAHCNDGTVPPPATGECCPDLSQCKPDKPDCATVSCLQEMCPDGSVAPVPEDGCCPDKSLCKPNCKNVTCLQWLVLCPDGSVAPVPEDGCCPDRSLCKPNCAVVRCLPELCPDGSQAPVPKDSCCPDRSLCKDCKNVNCLVHWQCPDGSPAPFPEGSCCNDRSLCKPEKPNCAAVSCVKKKCPDGSVAPVPKDGCCPDKSLCKPNCKNVACLQWLVLCPDGSVAPVPKDGCCPDKSLCKPNNCKCFNPWAGKKRRKQGDPAKTCPKFCYVRFHSNCRDKKPARGKGRYHSKEACTDITTTGKGNCKCINPFKGPNSLLGNPRHLCPKFCYVSCNSRCHDKKPAKGKGRCWSKLGCAGVIPY